MWHLKPRLFTLLAELVDLLREHNALTRELVEATTKRPARTPATRLSVALPRMPPHVINRKFTAADVTNRHDKPAVKQSAEPIPLPPAEQFLPPEHQ